MELDFISKKFSKRPPPGVIVEIVQNKKFSQSLESYCTSLSSKTLSYKIKKNELLEPINFNTKVNEGDVIVHPSYLEYNTPPVKKQRITATLLISVQEKE